LYDIDVIYSVAGELAFKRENVVGLEVSGVGYKITMSAQSVGRLPSVGSAVKIFTHLAVREDGWELFGFLDEESLKVFELLISVSGVGPKSALSVLNNAAPSRVLSAVAQGKTELLEKSSGIGKRLAARIILELGDKARSVSVGGRAVEFEDVDRDVWEALKNLGYKERDIRRVLSKIEPKLTKLADRLRDALKKI